MSDRVIPDVRTCKGAVSLIIGYGNLNPLRSLFFMLPDFHVGNIQLFIKLLVIYEENVIYWLFTYCSFSVQVC